MIVYGVELYTEGIFTVRTSVKGVFQRDVIKHHKFCCENEKKKEEPVGADLNLLLVELIEPAHS